MRVLWLLWVIIMGVSVKGESYEQRCNYVRPNMSSDEGVDQFIDVLKQSKDVGCTHILINEGRYLREADDRVYVARVNKVREVAKTLGLTIVPAV